MFYIFCSCIVPNTASTNRFLSFLRGFDELSISGIAILQSPSIDYYKIEEQFTNIKVKYLWSTFRFAGRIFNKLLRPIYLWRFMRTLKVGDIIFCYGSPGSVVKFVSKKGVQVYHERTESPDVLPLSSQRQQLLYLEACKRLDGLFVISTALRNYFISKGVDSKKIIIVNMTVDSNRFLNIKKDISVEKYIAYCGSGSNNKDGVDELIKSFAIVSKKHPDVKLYIIGKAPSFDDESGNLKLIEDLGIKKSVVFTGVINASKMPQLLKNASVLALDRPDSLQAQTGFPTKLGEYLLTENPVVVTNVGDIPLFLKDGVSALLVESRDQHAFASKLCWAIEHPIEAQTIGIRGRQVALDNFDYLKESRKITDVIFDNK